MLLNDMSHSHSSWTGAKVSSIHLPVQHMAACISYGNIFIIILQFNIIIRYYLSKLHTTQTRLKTAVHVVIMYLSGNADNNAQSS